MPIPKPNDGESREAFISRCMGNEAMRSEFPEQEQRSAVCFRQWRNRNRRDLTTVLVKSEGTYEDWFAEDLQEWFKSHVDGDGNVNEDITIFKTVGLKQDGDGVWWTLSDTSLDRDAERFDTTGWELKDYRKNPIVLWGHDKNRPAIGHMSKVKIEGDKLRGKITFDPKEVDEFSWMIGEKVKSGTIRAGSVGYKPTKIELVEDEKDPTKLMVWNTRSQTYLLSYSRR